MKHPSTQAPKHPSTQAPKLSRNKIIIVIMALIGLVTLQSNDDPIDPQLSFEQQPPIPEAFYLQKIENPTDDVNLILRVKFYDDPDLPQQLNLAQFGDDYILKDDGIEPDLVAGDFNYAMTMQQDFDALESSILELEEKAYSDGGITQFIGHDGEFIPEQDIVPFDFDAFNNFSQVQIYQPILNVTVCDQILKKENSLFITDLSVVEDLARTFRMEHTKPGDTQPTPAEGNPEGAWTFGTLMKNMANQPVTGISAKEFIKQWLITLNSTEQSPYNPNNGFYYTRPRRSHSLNDNQNTIVKHIIAPWLLKIDNSLPTASLTWNNWETMWDSQTEYDLLKYAPFRLMAIVNRFDLKGNAVYNSTLQNAGETRFIYTLINPETGGIPVHDDIVFGTNAPSVDHLDWEGMNIIIEYGNPFATECAAKNFAQQWYDLSHFTLGSNDYLEKLEDITRQVTDAGAGGLKNFNRSALNQIRTNEKLLDERDKSAPNANSENANWFNLNWEMRQFELTDNSFFLEPALVTNTPISVNETNLELPILSNLWNFNAPKNLDMGNPNFNSDLLDWIYGPNGNSINRIRVKFENHIIPNQFLDLSAIVDKEINHYFGFDWTQLPPNIYNQTNYNVNADIADELAKTIRHKVSLNTCQGCHAGENKTQFTQVLPQGFGKPAVYWNNGPPDGVNRAFDDRFGTLNPTLGPNPAPEDNTGESYDQHFQSNVDNSKFEADNNDQFKQAVSPFLTGRRYRVSNTIGGNGHTPNSWDDDRFGFGEGLIGQQPSPSNLADDQLTGLFFVNDPSNEAQTIPSGLPPGKGGVFPQAHDQKWGFNDLERRKGFLCKFINKPCDGSVIDVLDVMHTLSHIPFIKGSH